ncbi:MAG: peptidase M15A [Bacteroidetes bacterium]|nr:peptidase M15A [Bacteroidota bacterium]
MRLSKYFTIEEFVTSQTAARLGIDNTPPEQAIENMQELCLHILDPLREALKKPIIISSGYRSPELNQAIGGSPTSQHCLGLAADIIVPQLHPEEVFNMVVESDLPYDQVIEEFGQWTHLSYATVPRKQNLLARRENGKINYFKA